MGRSVSVPRGAAHVSYQSFSIDRFYCSACGETFNEFGSQEDEQVCPNCAAHEDDCYEEDSCEAFSDCLTNLKAELLKTFPSLCSDDRWIGNEDHAFASNSFAYFGVSEYCGLVAVWVVEADDCEQPGLRDNWIESIGAKFEKTVAGAFGKDLKKIGTFSNGEAVFRAAV
jgi:hypothetical protein